MSALSSDKIDKYEYLTINHYFVLKNFLTEEAIYELREMNK